MKLELRSFDCLTVCGMKGTGKTYLIQKLLPHYKEIFAFDPCDEFGEYPHYVPKSDSPKELESIAKVIWNRWNCMLIVSEAELYLPVNQPLPPSVFKIVARGRHRNVGLIADTRRIANLNKTVFGLSEWIFMFRHFSPNDIDYISKFVPTGAKELRELKDYYFLVYHLSKVETHEPI